VKVFLDTSILIAANDAEHPHFAPSFPLLAAATPETTFCGAHTLAETYSVLSRLPGSKQKRPEFASLLVDQMIARMTVIQLAVDEYATTIRNAAKSQQAGGSIYDALLLACARKADAERIYTWNLKHFHRLAPDLADRIMTP
jgi:predicted nucleic acid-binding protein